MGSVRYSGAVPPADKIDFAAGEECRPLMDSDRLFALEVGDAGGVQDVFVYVSSGLPATATYVSPEDPLDLINEDCLFVPKVAGMQVGQKLVMHNRDDVLHNFHGLAVKHEFNSSMPTSGMKIERTFHRSQVMTLVLCDIHPWMHSYVGVLEHPFFDTTDEAGRFRLEGLPSGSYTIEAWHRQLGTRSAVVHLSEKGSPASTLIQFSEEDLPAAGARHRWAPRSGRIGWTGKSSTDR